VQNGEKLNNDKALDDSVAAGSETARRGTNANGASYRRHDSAEAPHARASSLAASS
jgi:hypothetical protein